MNLTFFSAISTNKHIPSLKKNLAPEAIPNICHQHNSVSTEVSYFIIYEIVLPCIHTIFPSTSELLVSYVDEDNFPARFTSRHPFRFCACTRLLIKRYPTFAFLFRGSSLSQTHLSHAEPRKSGCQRKVVFAGNEALPYSVHMRESGSRQKFMIADTLREETLIHGWLKKSRKQQGPD